MTDQMLFHQTNKNQLSVNLHTQTEFMSSVNAGQQATYLLHVHLQTTKA